MERPLSGKGMVKKMRYISIDQLEQFEFHDSSWKLCSRDGDTVTFQVRSLNIHKHTEQNPYSMDMELDNARMTFRGFRLIHLEPRRSWRWDENGNGHPVGPRVLYTGEEGMDRLAKEDVMVFHFDSVEDHWEIGCCGIEPYFTVAFDFDSVQIEWDGYRRKAWYELHRYYPFQVTVSSPEGCSSEKLEIRVHEVGNYREDQKGKLDSCAETVTAALCWDGKGYIGKGKNDDDWTKSVADLQNKLPEGVVIRSCLTCRYGNHCPYGNESEQIFCLRDVDVANKMDVCEFFDEDEDVWTKRLRHCFDCCGDWAEMTPERYVYNDLACYLKY